MGDLKFPAKNPRVVDPHFTGFEIHRDGQPIEISTEIPLGPDGKLIKISPDQLSFYEPPQETRETSLKKAQQILAEAKNNTYLRNRLELLQNLHLLNLAQNFLSDLEKQESQKKSSSVEIAEKKSRAGQLILGIQEKLPKLLFNQLDSLLHPEGYPINGKYFVQGINHLFAMVYGKLPDGKDYFSAQEIGALIKSQAMNGMSERRALFQELELRARAKQPAMMTQSFPSLEQIQKWLSKTEMEGFRGSMDQEAELLSGMQKTLHKEGKSTKDAQYLLGISAEIRNLLKQERFDEARSKYLEKYAPSRLFFVDRYARYENGKMLKTIALHLAITFVSAGIGGLVGKGVVTALSVKTGAQAAQVSSEALIAGALLGFGPGFVISQRTFNQLLLNQQFFDPKKSVLQNGMEFAVESLLMGGLQLYLGAFLISSRMRTLLPTMSQRGLAGELLEGGALKPLTLEFHQTLNEAFIKEIAAMPMLQRYLFKGTEFFKEVGAFIPYQIAESQIKLFTQGNLPSLKSLEAIDQILKPENQIEQALFLLALKGGNRAIEPYLKPVGEWVKNKISNWKKNGFFASPPSPEATAITMGILSFIFPDSIPSESIPAAGTIMGSLKIKRPSHLPRGLKSELKYRIKRNSDWQEVSDHIDKISQLLEILKNNPSELEVINKNGNYLNAARKNLVVLVENLLDPVRFFTQSDRIDLLERYFHTIKSGDNLKINFEINNAELRSWIYGINRLLSLHKKHPEKPLLKNLLKDFQNILESTSDESYRQAQINTLKGHPVLEKIYDCEDIFIDAPFEEIYAAAKKGEEGALEALLKQDRSDPKVIHSVIDLATNGKNLKAQAALRKWNLQTLEKAIQKDPGILKFLPNFVEAGNPYAASLVTPEIKVQPQPQKPTETPKVADITPPAKTPTVVLPPEINIPSQSTSKTAPSPTPLLAQKTTLDLTTPPLQPKAPVPTTQEILHGKKYWDNVKLEIGRIKGTNPIFIHRKLITEFLLGKVNEMKNSNPPLNPQQFHANSLILVEIARANGLLKLRVSPIPGNKATINFEAILLERLRQAGEIIEKGNQQNLGAPFSTPHTTQSQPKLPN